MHHLDACLGCRGCEPVCPSGVAYGRGLEAARERLYAARGLPPLARAVLGVFRHRSLWRPLFTAARAFRATGIARALAGGGRVGFGDGDARGVPLSSRAERGIFSPCIDQRGEDPSLRSRMTGPPWPCSAAASWTRSSATSTTPRAEPSRHNGYRVVEVDGQACCGALHEHAGDRDAAVALARLNVAALADTADYVVTNSAGCGALLKDYGHLLDDEVAAGLAARVRDVSELLAAAGPKPGGASGAGRGLRRALPPAACAAGA